MNSIVSVIIGAAIPIIVMFINRWFDRSILEKTQKLTLEKEFFLKKLAAFEKATSYYSNAHLSISTMSMILKIATKENVDFDPKTMELMMSEIQTNMKSINIGTQEMALSLPLYTDIKLPESDEPYVTKYFELLGEINAQSVFVKMADAAVENTTSGPERHKFEKVLDDALEEMEKKFNELYEISKTVKLKYKELTRSLRLQLMKYEN